MASGSGAWWASRTGGGAPREVATNPASARKLPGLNIGAAAGWRVPTGSAQRVGSNCRPPSRPSITGWGSPPCRLRRTTATDWPNNG